MNIIETLWPWPWWAAIVAINIANVALCAHYYRQSKNAHDGGTSYLKAMRIMGLIFTIVALYRSIFVSRYLYQYGWFDTIANSSLLIRSFAWAAELAFAGLFAMAMLRFNADIPGRKGRNAALNIYVNSAPYLLVTCIFCAQFFATGGLITKSRLLFAIEETLWGVGFLCILPLAIIQFKRAHSGKSSFASTGQVMLRSFSRVNLIWCVIYCTYALVYHLPAEYWATAFQQLETGIPEIRSGTSAVRDALTVVHVTHDYRDWGFGFVLWHTAYFSVCVWLAIFLMRAPRKLEPPS
jgi:hypothetical protein